MISNREIVTGVAISRFVYGIFFTDSFFMQDFSFLEENHEYWRTLFGSQTGKERKGLGQDSADHPGGHIGAWADHRRLCQMGDNNLSAGDLAGLLVEETTEATEAEPTETTEPKPTAPDYGTTGKVINVLLIGQDAREGEDSKNADTMILVTVNKQTKKITMTSFLRDSLVYIENFVDSDGVTHSGRTKMTLCYALG